MRALTYLALQFTSMFDIIEPFLQAGGYKYVRCKSSRSLCRSARADPLPCAVDGKLNAAQKEVALRRIRTEPEITVILISLKVSSCRAPSRFLDVDLLLDRPDLSG